MPEVVTKKAEKNQELLHALETKMEAMIQKKIQDMNVVKKSPRLSSGSSLEEKFLLVNERIVRVEEELKHQRDILIDLKKDMDRRFEENQKYMDKRFEENQKYMDKRFEFIEKRFEAVDKRFEQVDKRFEDMQINMEKRFEQMEKRFVFMQWLIMVGFVTLGTLISVIKIFD